MKAIKPIKIVFESLEGFKERTKRELKKSIKTGKASIKSKNVIRFTSVAAYQQFMSDQKYSILAAIYLYKPKSVYQLAKILDRPQPNVIRDCDLLEGHGFIVQEETGEARKTKIPKLSFSYNAVLVCMSKLTYRVEFDEKAA